MDGMGAGRIKIDVTKCDGCGQCMEFCPVEAVIMEGDVPVIDGDRCTECGVCVDKCPQNAVELVG